MWGGCGRPRCEKEENTARAHQSVSSMVFIQISDCGGLVGSLVRASRLGLPSPKSSGRYVKRSPLIASEEKASCRCSMSRWTE